MKDDFFIKIETWHKPDLGTSENVHDLDPNTWKSVEVVHIDIADRTQVESALSSRLRGKVKIKFSFQKRRLMGNLISLYMDYKADEDPVLFQSMTTKRGPLGPNWKQEKRIFTNFHRQLFCWIDKWIDLTMEDIRRMEDETQRELEALRNQGQVRGTSAANDE
ncbi:phosphatidylinositol transfer protein beta isoform-like isoform X9 [Pelodiscus sinensis]|uniref:phosphatidylinositol transfer protein beta isoform-like isoform X9 n=1 Tax=Pelodiscus sinensis TaxID=13735 RepID=UPI003F6ADD3C